LTVLCVATVVRMKLLNISDEFMLGSEHICTNIIALIHRWKCYD